MSRTCPCEARRQDAQTRSGYWASQTYNPAEHQEEAMHTGQLPFPPCLLRTRACFACQTHRSNQATQARTCSTVCSTSRSAWQCTFICPDPNDLQVSRMQDKQVLLPPSPLEQILNVSRKQKGGAHNSRRPAPAKKTSDHGKGSTISFDRLCIKRFPCRPTSSSCGSEQRKAIFGTAPLIFPFCFAVAF